MAKKILLIDDDSDDRVLFSEAMHEVSPEAICLTEADGRKALSDLYDSSEELPDVIFLDINMPRISGWECLDKIKSEESTRDIPVIMFSTSSHQKDIERACRCGAACLLTKPADYEELKESLVNIVSTLHERAFFVYP
jgi:CheY-like chemotaxis protein